MQNNAGHPLSHPWTLWYTFRPQGEKLHDYEAAMKRVSSFSTVEDFWATYSHLKLPYSLPSTTEYCLFKDKIRPMWEDDHNRSGGKWSVRFRKGVVARFWERLVLALIGGQFSNDVCGIVLSVRNNEDIIHLWNRNSVMNRSNYVIRDCMMELMELPPEGSLEYKPHSYALKDQKPSEEK